MIKDIMAQSGAKIQIQDLIPEATTLGVDVTGTESQIDRAYQVWRLLVLVIPFDNQKRSYSPP